MRKLTRLGLTAVLLVGIFASTSMEPAMAGEGKPESEEEKYVEVPIKPLDKEELKELLQKRFNGKLGNDFKSFANVFFVSSVLGNLGKMVSLSTKSKRISQSRLDSVYPETYQPTLKEFLDVIALETGSTWRYDPEAKASSTAGNTEAIENCAAFNFEEADRKPPFKVKIADGWKKRTRAHSVIFVPPNFPVGMDIYQMGSYSADSKDKETQVLKEAPRNLALSWAKSLKKEAGPDDFKPAKVGKYDAVYFEADLKARNGEMIRWRQWTFMVGNKCYMVHSTIVPKLEDKLYPEVKAMLQSFEVIAPDKAD